MILRVDGKVGRVVQFAISAAWASESTRLRFASDDHEGRDRGEEPAVP
jgi:hypothetical protein